MTGRDEESGAPERGLVRGEDGSARCFWCASGELYRRYHDEEWGRPVDDDQRLFEKLSLEAFQAGLSWITILRKRENFREAFARFDYEEIAGWGEAEVERLLQDAGIVRNRQKIEAVLNNARRLPEVLDEFGSFADYVWQFAPSPGTRPSTISGDYLEAHTTSAESKALAKDLKARGWRFVGPTLTYSFMQAMGLVNDHISGCWVRPEIEEMRKAQMQRLGVSVDISNTRALRQKEDAMDWPSTLVPDSRTKEFTEETIPDNLRSDHSTKAGVWAMIRVVEGKLLYTVGEETEELTPRNPGFVEPEQLHSVEPDGAVRFYVEFYREASAR